jgi:hypothetical protein
LFRPEDYKELLNQKWSKQQKFSLRILKRHLNLKKVQNPEELSSENPSPVGMDQSRPLNMLCKVIGYNLKELS